MSQENVYEFLKRNNGWHTSKQIAEELNTSTAIVTNAAKKLARYRFIERRLMDDHVGYEYKLK
jgi:predicted transcriptional regulator|tara:strand:- start:169 stop:357 length:189 start_codon:yes stop_codon:yes gene_type:complete